MKRSPLHLSLACAGLLSIAISSLASAEYKCDRAHLTRVDHVACVKASQGPDLLRQYVWRTRMIHALYFPDYVRDESAAPALARPMQAAQEARPGVAGRLAAILN